ncbi:DUF805 domain-containing protein, partial [Marinomonas sp.]
KNREKNMNWYLDAWRHYGNFSGSASREAFWMFVLIHTLISSVFIVLEVQLHMTWKVDLIYSLLVILPFVSLTVRRLNDIKRSAWWLALVLIPAVGLIWLAILLAQPSRPSGDQSLLTHS